MRKTIGFRKLGNKVDVTDPSYDKEVWCRMNDVEILPGMYECFVDIWNNEQTHGWGDRVACVGIRRLNSMGVISKNIGEICVDSGLAGFYEEKPDFTDDDWSEFCDTIHDNYPTIYLHDRELGGRLYGFTVSSGYGDGVYPVYATKNSKGQVVGLEIYFMCDEEE